LGGYRIRRTRLRIGAKFFLVLALLTGCLLAAALVGAGAQARMMAHAERLYSENIVNMHRVAVLNATVAEAGWIALKMIR
jgi:hypothetical protein